MKAPVKPTTGEKKSALAILVTCDQSMAEVIEPGCMRWLAMATPRMDPIMVCELDAGRPRAQVSRFHRMAETRRAKTIEKPEPWETLRISSMGSSATIANATAPELVRTPMKFQNPDQTTATWGSSEWV